MKNSITVNGVVHPLGEINLQIDHFPDVEQPYSEINLVSSSDDKRCGGVALNCCAIPLRSPPTFPYEHTFRFSIDDDAEAGTELGESVFWQPGIETLEIRSLNVTFGAKTTAGEIEVTMTATCFDHTSDGISVHVAAVLPCPKSEE